MTPQTNEEIAEHCLISELAESIGRGRDYITAKALITQALDLKDTRIHSLEAGVEELKKALDHWTLMHIQESARSAKLEANLKIAVEAAGKMELEIENLKGGYCTCESYADYRLFHDGNEIKHGDCGKFLSPKDKSALSRLKSVGGEK